MPSRRAPWGRDRCRLRQLLYDRRLRLERREAGSDAAAIAVTDFELRREGLDEAIDLLAVCRRPRAVPSA